MTAFAAQFNDFSTRHESGTNAVGVLLADPDPISRHVLKALLSSTNELDLKIDVDSRIPVADWPLIGIDIVVLCVGLHDDLVSAITPLVDRGVRVVLLGTDWDRARLDLALSLGCMGCLVKTSFPENLALGVRAVSGNHRVLSPELLDLYVAPVDAAAHTENKLAVAQLDLLTAREREVIQLISGGASTDDVAKVLTVSTSTVKSHVSRALTKMGVRNRLEAVLMLQNAARHAARTQPAAPSIVGLPSRDRSRATVTASNRYSRA